MTKNPPQWPPEPTVQPILMVPPVLPPPSDWPINGFVRLKPILQRIPISRATWWSWVASGYAPASVKLSPKITVWRTDDIDEFVHRLSQRE